MSIEKAEPVPPGSIVIPPGRGKPTREALHKALDCVVAAYIGSWPPGELRSLTRTSIMDLMLWSAAWKEAEGNEGH